MGPSPTLWCQPRSFSLRLHLPAIRLSPLHELVPGDGTRLTLVSSELDAPPDLFGDPSRPTGLVDRAINRFDLIPSLSGHDLRQIRRVERFLGSRGGSQFDAGRQGG